MTLEDLSVALQWAQKRLDDAKSPWLRVVGPAGAVATTLQRIGWSWKSASLWVDDRGAEVSLLDLSPKAVHDLVAKGVERWTWRTLAHDQIDLQHLKDGADVRPLRKLITRPPSPDWGTAEQNGLEAAITRAAPCQSLLEAVDLATDFNCQICFQEGGSYLNRHWCCDGTGKVSFTLVS